MEAVQMRACHAVIAICPRRPSMMNRANPLGRGIAVAIMPFDLYARKYLAVDVTRTPRRLLSVSSV